MKKNKKFLRLLFEKELSKTDLAEKIDVTWQTVYHWSIGRNKPSAEKMVKMAEVFGVTFEDIYKIFNEVENKK